MHELGLEDTIALGTLVMVKIERKSNAIRLDLVEFMDQV